MTGTSLIVFAEDAASGSSSSEEPGHCHIPAGDPVWNWSSDYTACTTVFTCADCGEPFSREALVLTEWQGEGPDKNGNGRYYYTASVSVDGRNYFGYSPVFVSEGYKDPDPCPWDGIDHGVTFYGKMIRLFHRILYLFAHMFELNQYGY